MDLTRQNYHTTSSNMEYMGTSQFKSFMKCEAAALAEVKGDWKRSPTPSMLMGSYVDAHFSGTRGVFVTEHPEAFKKNGELLAVYAKAEVAIERIESDPAMMHYLSGDKQVIMTGEIAGIKFKIMMDSYLPGKEIVDLKYMKDFGFVWQDHEKKNFVEAWGYDYQAAIYREIEGNGLPFIIAAATKETEPDIGLFIIPHDVMDDRIDMVRAFAPQFQMIKLGLKEPTRCERCDYCKATRVLTGPVDYRDMEDI